MLRTEPTGTDDLGESLGFCQAKQDNDQRQGGVEACATGQPRRPNPGADIHWSGQA